MKIDLYPLKFHPVFKEKIWGGEKLNSFLGKAIPSGTTGESWEITAIPESISTVQNGSLADKSLVELVKKYRENLVGKKVFKKYGNEFPLLFKYIDAKQNLSLQLHPDDELAEKRHNSFGKTEMWYIMQADEQAGIYVGFKDGITEKDYLHHLNQGSLKDIMNFEEVQEGDVFYIKPGLVHSIGKGVFLAEIQQSSDITYRVFDWNRADKDGKPRKLHTELAKDAINFDFDKFKINYTHQTNTSQALVKEKYFTTQFIHLRKNLKKSYATTDSFVVYMCMKGVVSIHTSFGNEEIKRGETILIPACINEVELLSEEAQLLEIFI